MHAIDVEGGRSLSTFPPPPLEQLDSWCIQWSRNWTSPIVTLESAPLIYVVAKALGVCGQIFYEAPRKLLRVYNKCYNSWLWLCLSSLLLHTGPHPAGSWLSEYQGSARAEEWPRLKERQECQLSLAPFLKLLIQGKIMSLLEMLFYICLHGFGAAQKWTCRRVVVDGPVVRSFISLWCLKDLK